jgi:hypothetical protein
MAKINMFLKLPFSFSAEAFFFETKTLSASVSELNVWDG